MIPGPVFSSAPRRVYWEVTRACDLACRHCRAEAAPEPDPVELSTAEGFALIDRLAGFGAPLPHLVLTGGDPLKRADLFRLISLARALGLPVSVAPSATPLLTPQAVRRLRAAGVEAISLSLDGADAAQHDALRGFPGCFDRTLEAARAAREVGLPYQVNTLVSAETLARLPAVHELVKALGAARWSLFFLVAVGRGTVLRPILPAECEGLFEWLAGLPRDAGLVVTTTEAPHFRRVLLQKKAGSHGVDRGSSFDHPRGPAASLTASREADAAGRLGLAQADAAAAADTPPGPGGPAAGIRDGNGIMFISSTGIVYPSGFFPLPAGSIRRESPVAIYRRSPVFRSLRRVDLFEGRCGRCEFRGICGGSRARAFSATGNPLAEDPLCTYQPVRVATAVLAGSRP